MAKKLIIANWKMNGNRALATALTRAAGDALGRASAANEVDAPDVILCPPFPYLDLVGAILAGGAKLGAQDVAVTQNSAKGAQTGDVAPTMLAELGCAYVILGHSERRAHYGETSAQVAAKAAGVIAAGMGAIICVGETGDERKSGRAFDVVKEQVLSSIPKGANVNNLVLAYEPVWAIGAGMPARLDDIMAMHEFIRRTLQESLAPLAGLRMVYGASVKADNAAAILSSHWVDGVLVGGASLKSEEFTAIIQAAAKAA